MVDGSFKRIADVKIGDYVHTGFQGDVGLVTEVLKHEVGRDVPVAIVPTSFGNLIGTLDHPIYFNHQWIELSEALNFSKDGTGTIMKNKALLDGRVSVQNIDWFYNLEVDGHIPGMSGHSYVVNGIIASGLGDNVKLNTLFQRQKAWKVVERIF